MTVIQPTTSSTPTLTRVISADDGRGGVAGVTSVDNRLFVIRSPSQQCIEEYDLTTFKLRQKLAVKDLSDWGDNGLTACVISKCLYVSDHDSDAVFKVQLANDNKILKWSVGSGPIGLSINTAHALLVACYKDGKIQEYDSSGSLVREICLKSNDTSLSPFHVKQLTSGQFLVTCWYNGIYELFQVDANGQIVVNYTNQLQSTAQQSFLLPRQLAVDKDNECIPVTDTWNNRIVILSRSLNRCAREFNVTSVDGGLQRPSCLHFDESQGRLIVGEDSGQGRVLVFDKVINIANSF
jgi:DNA-binding beta-propeller fold protein YncE